jgi:hypothetical protein
MIGGIGCAVSMLFLSKIIDKKYILVIRDNPNIISVYKMNPPNIILYINPLLFLSIIFERNSCAVSMLFLSKIIDKNSKGFMYSIIFGGFILYTLMIS